MRGRENSGRGSDRPRDSDRPPATGCGFSLFSAADDCKCDLIGSSSMGSGSDRARPEAPFRSHGSSTVSGFYLTYYTTNKGSIQAKTCSFHSDSSLCWLRRGAHLSNLVLSLFCYCNSNC